MSTATLQVTTPSDREIALTRVFNAFRKLVFDCFTKPGRLKRAGGLGPASADAELVAKSTFRRSVAPGAS